jgi:hypothetical protein
MTWSRILLFSGAALLLASQHLRAAPLDADTCSKLDAERLQLEFAGVRANVAKGPEWAKTVKLSAEALGQIRRLIDIDAQLLFRCTGANLVSLPTDPPDPETAGPQEQGEEGKETPGQKASPAKAKPETAKKAAATPQAKAPGNKAAPADKSQPAKKAPADKTKAPEKKASAAPPAKTKPKVDDAYKPPAPADPNANPFAAKTTHPK